jgi:hypothetical protein
MTSSGRELLPWAALPDAKPLTRRPRREEPDLEAGVLPEEPEDDRIASMTFVFCCFATIHYLLFPYRVTPRLPRRSLRSEQRRVIPA